MNKFSKYVGLDTHKKTIAVAAMGHFQRHPSHRVISQS